MPLFAVRMTVCVVVEAFHPWSRQLPSRRFVPCCLQSERQRLVLMCLKSY